MSAQKGSAFLLKISDGADPAAYQTVAGLRTTQMSISGDAVVITNKASGGWRELLSGAGARSASEPQAASAIARARAAPRPVDGRTVEARSNGSVMLVRAWARLSLCLS